jgi:hypothetical protein
MTEATALLDYVNATAALLGLPLDEARAMRVAENLARTAAMARVLEAVPLAEHDEPADLYCPAPWIDVDAMTDVRGAQS